jgi:hypothetical protein
MTFRALSVAALALGLAIGCATTPAPTSSKPAGETAENGAQPEKKNCRRVKPTGSHIWKKVCEGDEDGSASQMASQSGDDFAKETRRQPHPAGAQ